MQLETRSLSLLQGLDRATLTQQIQARAAHFEAVGQVLRWVAVARGRRGAAVPASQLPVALIALDRSVIRRMRALLDEHGVAVADETGWKLSTTRAAAALSRFVQAAPSRASTDDVLDWFKSAWTNGEGGREVERQQALGELERWCRRHAVPRVWLVADGALPESLPEAAGALLLEARQQLAPLGDLWAAGRKTLAEWLGALREALVASDAWEVLIADEAGRLACESLRLGTSVGADGDAVLAGLGYDATKIAAASAASAPIASPPSP